MLCSYFYHFLLPLNSQKWSVFSFFLRLLTLTFKVRVLLHDWTKTVKFNIDWETWPSLKPGFRSSSRWYRSCSQSQSKSWFTYKLKLHKFWFGSNKEFSRCLLLKVTSKSSHYLAIQDVPMTTALRPAIPIVVRHKFFCTKPVERR